MKQHDLTDGTRLVVAEDLDEVLLVRLNRPQVLNAMNSELVDQFEEVIAAAEVRDEIRAVVLTGNGRGFCSGEDLSAAATESAELMSAFVARLQVLTRRLLDLGRPVVAAVNGPAVGGGAELALACDVRLASDVAFFRFPEAEIGIICTGGTLFLLSEMVGRGRATELLMTGRTLSAEEALRDRPAVGDLRLVRADRPECRLGAATRERVSSRDAGTQERAPNTRSRPGR